MLFKYIFSHFCKIKSDDEKFFEYYYKAKKINNSSHVGGGVKKIKLSYYTYKMYRLQKMYNCMIPLSSQIAEKPIFPHGLSGIFITACKIGRGCVIFQQVTIGANTLPDSKNRGTPVIGDNVYIGAGAKIIGNVKIGNNVRIGANTTVTKDIPSNSTVVNGKIRIFSSNEEKNNKYVKYSEFKEKYNQ